MMATSNESIPLRLGFISLPPTVKKEGEIIDKLLPVNA